MENRPVANVHAATADEDDSESVEDPAEFLASNGSGAGRFLLQHKIATKFKYLQVFSFLLNFCYSVCFDFYFSPIVLFIKIVQS